MYSPCKKIALLTITYLLSICSCTWANNGTNNNGTGDLTINPVFKECFRNSTNCVGVKMQDKLHYSDGITTCETDCIYLATFRLNTTTTRLDFSLFSRNSGRYVAVGISMDEKMGDDVVVACVHSSYGPDEILSYVSWNSGYKNRRLGDQSLLIFESGFISPDGMLCKLSLPTMFTANGVDFSLRGQSYHLLLAGGLPDKDFIKYHDARVATVLVGLDGLAARANASAADYSAEKIHAGYMVFSWIVWIPTGTFVSRFYKETWSTVYIWNRRLWFIVHTSCMIFATLMALTAYILVMYDRNQWLPPEEPSSIHGLIGAIAISCLVVQSICGWVRPPNVKTKHVLAKIHCIIGVTAYLLGIINIILAPVLTQNVLPCSATTVAAVWLSFQILLIVTMTGYISWTDWHLKIGGWRAVLSYPMPIASHEEAVRPNLRKAILVLFVFLAMFCTILIIGSMRSFPCAASTNLKCSIYSILPEPERQQPQ